METFKPQELREKETEYKGTDYFGLSWAQRNPRTSSRFDGVSLPRFADRTWAGALIQDPPRSTL